MRFLGGMFCLFLASVAIACGGGDSTRSTDVSVSLSEWEITLDPAGARAGEVTFTFENEGELAHDFVIVKSDLPPAELPVTDGGVDKSKLNVIGTSDPIAPGSTPSEDAAYRVTLSAGKYVLFCDVVTAGENHYRNGMYTSLLVEP